MNQTKKKTARLGSISDIYNPTYYPASQALDGATTDLYKTATGAYPYSWLAITLPETVLIRRVKAFPYEVTSTDAGINPVTLLQLRGSVVYFHQHLGAAKVGVPASASL